MQCSPAPPRFNFFIRYTFLPCGHSLGATFPKGKDSKIFLAKSQLTTTDLPPLPSLLGSPLLRLCPWHCLKWQTLSFWEHYYGRITGSNHSAQHIRGRSSGGSLCEFTSITSEIPISCTLKVGRGLVYELTTIFYQGNMKPNFDNKIYSGGLTSWCRYKWK